MERTWVYILSSVVVSLSGIVLLLAQQGQAVWVSIATSLIAGGLASSAFATIRYFDDRDVRQTAAEIKYVLAEIRGIGLANNDQIDGLRRNLALSAAADGRVFDRHPENEVAELIDNQRGKLRIEVMGLTLRPFVRDQLERIEKKDSAHLRLLVQDPGHATFGLS